MADEPRINALAAPAEPAAKATAVWKRPPAAEPQKRQGSNPWAGKGSGGKTVSKSPQFQRPNPHTNAGGVPRQTGQGERQLDGTRTPTFDQPQKKPGLAARDAVPNRGARESGSGLEAAMGAEADRLHPRKSRSK